MNYVMALFYLSPKKSKGIPQHRPEAERFGGNTARFNT